MLKKYENHSSESENSGSGLQQSGGSDMTNIQSESQNIQTQSLNDNSLEEASSTQCMKAPDPSESETPNEISAEIEPNSVENVPREAFQNNVVPTIKSSPRSLQQYADPIWSRYRNQARTVVQKLEANPDFKIMDDGTIIFKDEQLPG